MTAGCSSSSQPPGPPCFTRRVCARARVTGEKEEARVGSLRDDTTTLLATHYFREFATIESYSHHLVWLPTYSLPWMPPPNQFWQLFNIFAVCCNFSPTNFIVVTLCIVFYIDSFPWEGSSSASTAALDFVPVANGGRYFAARRTTIVKTSHFLSWELLLLLSWRYTYLTGPHRWWAVAFVTIVVVL